MSDIARLMQMAASGAGAGSGGPTLSDLEFYESRYGIDMGSVYVYIVSPTGTNQRQVYFADTDTGTPDWALAVGSEIELTEDFRVAWWYGAGGSFQGDYAIDTVSILENNYNFDADNDGFLTTSGATYAKNQAAAALASAIAVPTSTSSVLGRWNRNSGTTPSGGTGPNSAQSGTHYLYCESSGDNQDAAFWLFSPVISP